MIKASLKNVCHLWLLIFFGLSSAVTSMADPLNFMVGDFTFVRPKTWEWDPETRHARNIVMKLKVVDAQSDTFGYCVFIPSTNSPDALLSQWKGYFKEKGDKLTFHSEKKEFGKHNVTYVNIEGTFPWRKKDLPNYGLLGATIETKGTNVYIRLIAPKVVIEKNRTDFKEMVESAFKEGNL